MEDHGRAVADHVVATPETPAARGLGEPGASLLGGERLISEGEAAALLGVAQRTLQGWRRCGAGPRFLRLSRRAIRYRPNDLAAWMIAHLEGGAG
jgi:predicted DNA-binding transcriptional regulator AlpA